MRDARINKEADGQTGTTNATGTGRDETKRKDTDTDTEREKKKIYAHKEQKMQTETEAAKRDGRNGLVKSNRPDKQTDGLTNERTKTSPKTNSNEQIWSHEPRFHIYYIPLFLNAKPIVSSSLVHQPLNTPQLPETPHCPLAPAPCPFVPCCCCTCAAVCCCCCCCC